MGKRREAKGTSEREKEGERGGRGEFLDAADSHAPGRVPRVYRLLELRHNIRFGLKLVRILLHALVAEAEARHATPFFHPLPDCICAGKTVQDRRQTCPLGGRWEAVEAEGPGTRLALLE